MNELLMARLEESIRPKNEKERKKIARVVSKISVNESDGLRSVRLPFATMYFVHGGDLYDVSIIRSGEVVEVYEESCKTHASCKKDCYGRFWYCMEHDDTVYDDYHMVFYLVEDESEAEHLYHKIGVNTYSYFCLCEEFPENCPFPLVLANTSGYMTYYTKDLSVPRHDFIEELVCRNLYL